MRGVDGGVRWAGSLAFYRTARLFYVLSPFMAQRSALLRLSEIAVRDVVPFARGLIQRTRKVVDDLALRALGPDFEERSAIVRDRYERVGGDPFGFDPGFTKYPAMAGAA